MTRLAEVACRKCTRGVPIHLAAKTQGFCAQCDPAGAAIECLKELLDWHECRASRRADEICEDAHRIIAAAEAAHA